MEKLVQQVKTLKVAHDNKWNKWKTQMATQTTENSPKHIQ